MGRYDRRLLVTEYRAHGQRWHVRDVSYDARSAADDLNIAKRDCDEARLTTYVPEECVAEAVAKEREACAKACRDLWRELDEAARGPTAGDDAETLRGEAYGALACERLVRARGKANDNG